MLVYVHVKFDREQEGGMSPYARLRFDDVLHVSASDVLRLTFSDGRTPPMEITNHIAFEVSP